VFSPVDIPHRLTHTGFADPPETQKTMMPLPLSVCLVVRDEAEMLPRCLESVRQLAAEILVLDTGSGDGTADIAARLGATVQTIAWDHDFAGARNQLLATATQPWILMLDADEWLDDEARSALQDLVLRARLDSVYLLACHDGQADRTDFKPYLFPNSPYLRYYGRFVADLLPSAPGFRHEIVEGVRIDHRRQDRPAAQRAQRHQYHVDQLRLSLEQHPEDPGPLLPLCRLHLDAGEYAEALAMAEAGIDGLPEGTNLRLMAYFYAALVNYRKGAWDDAGEHARTGLALYRDYTELHALLGLTYLKQKEYQAAEESLSTAIYLSRRPPRAPLVALGELRPPALIDALAKAYEAMGSDHLASLCRKLTKATPTESTNILFHELSTQLRRKQWDVALWLVTVFLPVDIAENGVALLRALEGPYSADRYLAEASLWSTLLAIGKTSPMPKRLLTYAADHFPLDPRPFQRLAQLAIQEENWVEAIGRLNEALRLDNRSGWAWNALGIASVMVSNLDRARTCFETALQVGTPADVEGARQNLAKLNHAPSPQ
jgi:glycosyltransferase involved in cell wall biosynthesis